MRVIAMYGPRDLREEEWPKPDPGAGEVRVRIMSVTVCGSDALQFADGHIGDLTTPVPFILGHEAAGLVDSVGPGVTGLPEGTPVALEPNMPCLACEPCQRGRQNLCRELKYLGCPPVHGALAEYVIVPAHCVYPVKAKVSFAEMACIEPLAVAIYTMRSVRLMAGETVAIFGMGGIGQVCLLAARVSGARVVAVTDRVVSRLGVADKFGAARAINIAEKRAVEEIMTITNGRGVDVAIVAAGELDALRDAAHAAVRGGRIALLGVPHTEEWALPASPARRSELLVHNIRRSNHTTGLAVEWVERGVVNLAGLISHRLPWEKAEEAYERASKAEEGTLRIALEPEESSEPYYR